MFTDHLRSWQGRFDTYTWSEFLVEQSKQGSIGTADVEKSHGQTASRSTRFVRIVAVTGGVLAMFVAGAFVGGIIAFLVAALAVFSEQIAADASPTDRNLARILLLVGGALGWIVLGVALGLQLNVRIVA